MRNLLWVWLVIFGFAGLSTFIDARAVAQGAEIETDLLIVGGGPAGISLALALANQDLRIVLLESGAMEFDGPTQALYEGTQDGVPYLALDGSRMRFLGGGTNHWGGWCRPLERIDFEAQSWLAHSGWPFARSVLEPYFARAQALVEAGPFIYDQAAQRFSVKPLNVGRGGVETVWFQFSKMRDSQLPTQFGRRYADELATAQNISLYTHANVTGLRLTRDAKMLSHVDVATLSGVRFAVKPKRAVLCAGAIESARLMLASRDVMRPGVGNQYDLVGRYFADHPLPGDNATLVVFDGALAPHYLATQIMDGTRFRAAFAPSDAFRRTKSVTGALITVDGGARLDALGQAAVVTTANALGVSSQGMKAFSVGCGLEPEPDPERRIMLAADKDALGMPRVVLKNALKAADFARYRTVLEEWGRQMLAARTGMLRIHRHSEAEWLEGLDWANHHMGTLRMHEDPKQGVTDADGRVHGIGNLYVAGSALFPTYGASNPTMNLVALTLRLADHLKAVAP